MAELSTIRNVRGTGEWNLASVTSLSLPSASITGSALSSAADVERSQLKQQDAQVYGLELADWLVTGTGAKLGAAAGTPTDAFGLTVGTFGSASPKIVGESASGNSKTNYARTTFTLPPEYVDGQTVTFRVRARITASANTSQTVDFSCYEADGEAGIGSDLCTTSAQTLTTSFADYDFTVTPSSLAAGDLLDMQITGEADDTGGSAGAVIEIGKTQILLDIRG